MSHSSPTKPLSHVQPGAPSAHVPCPEQACPASPTQDHEQFGPPYPAWHRSHTGPSQNPLPAEALHRHRPLPRSPPSHTPCPLQNRPASSPRHSSRHSDPKYPTAQVEHAGPPQKPVTAFDVHTQVPFPARPAKHTPCPSHGWHVPPGHTSLQLGPKYAGRQSSQPAPRQNPRSGSR